MRNLCALSLLLIVIQVSQSTTVQDSRLESLIVNLVGSSDSI